MIGKEFPLAEAAQAHRAVDGVWALGKDRAAYRKAESRRINQETRNKAKRNTGVRKSEEVRPLLKAELTGSH